MEKITFNQSWKEKVFNDLFTTIRLPSRKYELGRTYEIWLNKNCLGHAKLVDMRRFLLSELPNISAFLDTGYSKEETQNMIREIYKSCHFDWDKKQIAIILLQYTNKLFTKRIEINQAGKRKTIL